VFETDEDKRAADKERRMNDYAFPYRFGVVGVAAMIAAGLYEASEAGNVRPALVPLLLAFWFAVALGVAWKAVEQREDLR
jgi:hypothetical protein